MSFTYSKDPISIEQAIDYLSNFDPANDSHVDIIEKPEGGQLYFFFSKDESKLRKHSFNSVYNRLILNF